MAEARRIGFVGAGLMGHGMARNLLAKGHQVELVAHRRRQAADDLLARGATEAPSPAAMASRTELAILCLPTSEAVERVVLGPDGVAAGMGDDYLVVDCTTGEPETTRRVAARLREQGATLIDAPLTRTPRDAEAGRLNVIVGAEPATFDRVRPILDCFAENVFHVGPPGAGHTLKLVNNFISMGTAALLAEALAVAARSGVDPARLHAVVSAGGANSNTFQKVMEWVLHGDDSGMRFTLENAHKDLRYFTRLAGQQGVAHPLGQSALRSFALALALGAGERYVPALTAAIAGCDGIEVGPSS
jgi:3-hydroxyisobutyrate dehydrogenase-like beta-hydroxyacid dehydrogenase